MASIEQLLRSVEESPGGPGIAAIFDFDGTVIAGYSATVFIREQVRRGDLSARDLTEIARAMASFGMGNLGFSAMMVVTSQFMRGISEESYIEAGEELYQKHIARLIYPESRALVDAHIKKGHTVAIISSATPYQVAPAARDLGIEHVLCTHLEVKDGVFTGGVVRPTCFGEGKVRAAQQLAEESGADLKQSFFYSDSTDDLQLLECVGRPHALNPSAKLERYARRKKWPVASFGSRGRASLGQYARSAAATASLVTSFVSGLPIYALTGSRRDAVNFSFSLFADTASALVGMDLKVQGEEHLWSQRPAVFVFNHQSKADVIIIAKLLRRDIAGIGKKEIRDMPVIGRVMEAGGVVLIDRANSASAIEAMQPLVDVMKNEGKSVVLAPEGTRTVSPRLNPFKKGAFHLAIQAGVPMVPIVIRNAGDVAPKGDFVFRPATVDVTVLPPVDTSNWRVDSINEHVAEVRGMFLNVLGQSDKPVARKKPAAKKKAVAKKKPAAKKKAAKRKASTGARATAAKKAVPRKAAGGKSMAKKPVAKRAAVAKSVVKKPVAKKPAAKKSAAKKPPAAKRKATAVRPKSVAAARPKIASKARPAKKKASPGKTTAKRKRS